MLLHSTGFSKVFELAAEVFYDSLRLLVLVDVAQQVAHDVLELGEREVTEFV